MIEMKGLHNPVSPWKEYGIPIWLRITEPMLLKKWSYADRKKTEKASRAKWRALVAWDGNGSILHFESGKQAAEFAGVGPDTIRGSMYFGSKSAGYYWFYEVSIR
jgi:hypothetical protein